MENDTIAAIATPIGEGGIGIIRISGDDAIEVASKIFRPRSSAYRSLADVESYRAVYGDIVDDDVTRDEAIAIIMRAPHSYTTEDVCELQCHGGATVMRVVLELALKNGARRHGRHHGEDGALARRRARPSVGQIFIGNQNHEARHFVDDCASRGDD